MCKLFEVAYEEEIPFSKYPGVLDLEKRHGVKILIAIQIWAKSPCFNSYF